MQITLIAVGKLKERYFTEAVGEYSKRLGRYCGLKILEVADEPTPEGASLMTQRQILDREGTRILKQIREGSHCIALAIGGKKYDSEGLAEHLEQLGIQGRSDLTFVIGGSLGLSQAVLARANEQLSFSDLTFPHQLMRVMLLEQLYRSFRIIHHEPYHK